MTDAHNTEISTDDLDALLGNLEIPDEIMARPEAVEDIVEEVIEEPEDSAPVELQADVETVLDDETADAIEAEMELQDTREELYAAQESDDTDLEATEDSAPAAAAPAKPAKAKKASTAKNPRIAVESLPVDAFVLTTHIPDDLEANKATVLASCPAQKKVKEKFDNILTSIHQAKAPSTYIMDCFRVLDAKGEVTSPELVAALKGTNLKNGVGTYSEGTARSQVGQIMALFPALKIVVRNGNKITLNPDSLLAEALRDLNGTAASTEEEIPAAPVAEDEQQLAA